MDTGADERAHRERREKFVHHVRYFDVSTRYPAPYVGFTGAPDFKSEHHHIPFDAFGFLNHVAVAKRTDPDEIRVFVVGDSSMIAGVEHSDTVPGWIEHKLRENYSPNVKMFNFGVASSCLEQMCALIWMRLLDYDPDILIVMSGATDAFQPYTFDCRPGHPYNSFIVETLYTYFFDEANDKSWAVGLNYDALIERAFDHLTRIKAEVGHGTQAWEGSIAENFATNLGRVGRLARAIDRPVFYFLEPLVVRKDPLAPSEQSLASPDALAYLARQYDRFEAAIHRARAAGMPENLDLNDFSRALNGRPEIEFYDIVHYNNRGRMAMAEAIAYHVIDRLKASSAAAAARPGVPAPVTPRTPWWRRLGR